MYITCLFNLSSPGLSCQLFLVSYKSHKQDILQKHLQIDQSAHAMKYFLGPFMCQGCRTKSYQNHCKTLPKMSEVSPKTFNLELLKLFHDFQSYILCVQRTLRIKFPAFCNKHHEMKLRVIKLLNIVL